MFLTYHIERTLPREDREHFEQRATRAES